MGLFTSSPDDLLWKFKIKDLFPHDAELARYVLMVLTANEDLSTIERLKDLLEAKKPRPETDEFARAKWASDHLFLVRLRFGFLHNVWEDILGTEEVTPILAGLIAKLGDEVRESHEALRNAVSSYPSTKAILKNFRNQAAFHYDPRHLEKALKIGGENTGEIIIEDSDVHFLVAYQILDLVPAGRQSREDVVKTLDEIELIQEKFHAFVRVLFLAYSRPLLKKVEITKYSSLKE